jgi:hypothetical protein
MGTVFSLTISSCPQHCIVGKLAKLANLDEGREDTSSTPQDEDEEQFFQETYKERTHVKFSVSRDLGYMSTPRSNKVYQERLLHEKLHKVEARERQLEEIFKMHEANKEHKKEEFKKMVEKQMQEQFAKMIELIKHLLPCSEVT